MPEAQRELQGSLGAHGGAGLGCPPLSPSPCSYAPHPPPLVDGWGQQQAHSKLLQPFLGPWPWGSAEILVSSSDSGDTQKHGHPATLLSSYFTCCGGAHVVRGPGHMYTCVFTDSSDSRPECAC